MTDLLPTEATVLRYIKRGYDDAWICRTLRIRPSDLLAIKVRLEQVLGDKAPVIPSSSPRPPANKRKLAKPAPKNYAAPGRHAQPAPWHSDYATDALAVAAASFDLTVEEMLAPVRKARLSAARHLAIHLLRACDPPMSLHAIMLEMRRDRATIRDHLIRKPEPQRWLAAVAEMRARGWGDAVGEEAA